MYGAILGDIIGSPFEFDRGNKTKKFDLFSRGCGFTDDSVMTIAIGEALLAVGKEATVEEIKEAVTVNMRDWGKKYPNAGYGGSFWHWLRDKHPRPYGSYGNGSAMRVSAAGWLYDSLERTREVARATAEVTHNHPEGVKGAEATASCIFLARRGFSKDEIRSYVETKFHYNLDRTLDAIRPYYHHVESCQETVPEAIIAFMEAKNFEDTIRNAVSLGGDTDTLGAIAGSIAEAFYGIPDDLKNECRARIPEEMLDVLDIFDERLGKIQGTIGDYKGMAKVEFAIEKIYSEVRQENMIDFLGTIAYAMQEDLQCNGALCLETMFCLCMIVRAHILFIRMGISDNEEELRVVALNERQQLTERQQLVYEGIIDYQKVHGFAPSVRELGMIVGLASTSSVYSQLKSLEEKGYIMRRPESPRAIAVL